MTSGADFGSRAEREQAVMALERRLRHYGAKVVWQRIG
jgi:hypothetical protein